MCVQVGEEIVVVVVVVVVVLMQTYGCGGFGSNKDINASLYSA